MMADGRVSIVATYRALLSLVVDANELRTKLSTRATSSNPFKVFPRIKSVRQQGLYALAESHAAAMRTNASAEEKSNPLFDAATDPHWPELLARHAASELSLTQPIVRALTKIHDAEEATFERAAHRVSPQFLIPVVLAAGLFVLNQVPKELFEYFGWEAYYAGYRTVVFVSLLVAIIYVVGVVVWIGAMLGPSAPGRVRRLFRDARAVLSLLEGILESERDDPVAVVSRPEVEGG